MKSIDQKTLEVLVERLKKAQTEVEEVRKGVVDLYNEVDAEKFEDDSMCLDQEQGTLNDIAINIQGCVDELSGLLG